MVNHFRDTKMFIKCLLQYIWFLLKFEILSDAHLKM